MKGFVHELFTSIQGEGIRIGERQTFIRLRGCNLACAYCDTPEAREHTGGFECRGQQLENPVDAGFIVKQVTENVAAITGGEPLLQPDFLAEICTRLKAQDTKVYLETNGTLPGALQQVIDSVDTVALDFKIETATGAKTPWDVHEACLKIAAQKDVFVKIVLRQNATKQEIERVCSIIERVNKYLPLVIQPIDIKPIEPYCDIQKHALRRLPDVRIIPQLHKYLGLR